MSGTCCLNRPTTCAGSAGAAMVTTARVSGNSPAAHRTAAPPKLWPIRISGARNMTRMWFAAATRSATLEEKFVLANSPSLAPSPVKSNRDTALGQAFGDALCREVVLAAGKAVREQRVSDRRTSRTVEQRGQLLAAR